MQPNVSFMCSDICLFNRQSCYHISENDDDAFLNLSSYGNQKLLTHMRKSFSRDLSE